MAAYKTVTVIGGNLYALALQYLGDATQWNRIAELSLTGPDPILPTGVSLTLLIPAVNLAAGGGIYHPPINPHPRRDTILIGRDGAVLLGRDGAEFRSRR